jgi:hypothetical protein
VRLVAVGAGLALGVVAVQRIVSPTRKLTLLTVTHFSMELFDWLTFN